MVSRICRVWLCTATLLRRFKTTDSGCSASCTPTMRTCAVLIRCSWQTASLTKCSSGKSAFSRESTSDCASSSLQWRRMCRRYPRTRKRRRSRAISEEEGAPTLLIFEQEKPSAKKRSRISDREIGERSGSVQDRTEQDIDRHINQKRFVHFRRNETKETHY